MACPNSPIPEFCPPGHAEVGNEPFWYIFKGEPMAKRGYIELDDSIPGLSLEIDEAARAKFKVTG